MFSFLKHRIMRIGDAAAMESQDGSRDLRLVGLVNEARSAHEQWQIARGH
jgi:hypothetical protein